MLAGWNLKRSPVKRVCLRVFLCIRWDNALCSGVLGSTDNLISAALVHDKLQQLFIFDPLISKLSKRSALNYSSSSPHGGKQGKQEEFVADLKTTRRVNGVVCWMIKHNELKINPQRTLFSITEHTLYRPRETVRRFYFIFSWIEGFWTDSCVWS